jgi:Ca2+-transporting ATPase
VQSDPERGLSESEVALRLAKYGPNRLKEGSKRSLFALVVSQFKSPLIYLLLAAAVLAFLLGHTTDAGVILVVVVLNAAIGALQEGRAERSLRALRRMTTQSTRVMRDGKERAADAATLVPGDVLLLTPGDAVPADGRLLEAVELQTAEAALTGESLPTAKNTDALRQDTPLAERMNMLYAGTHVTSGRGRLLVTATGAETELGRIAQLARAAEEPKTPLERRIAHFGRAILWSALALFLAVCGIAVARGIPLGEVLMLGISQLVGMIPEGLPVAMTIALAVGVQRMARRGAIIRRLVAVETLGSTTVICTDKTGTLTRNEMTVTALWLPPNRNVIVSGSGYVPQGSFSEAGSELTPSSDAQLLELLGAGVLCNDAHLTAPHAGTSPRATGDPTEVALVALAAKAGLVDDFRSSHPRRAEIPFDSATKLMATQHDFDTGPRIVLKGAPEIVLELCNRVRTNTGDVALAPELQRDVRAQIERMANEALRVLAVASVEGELRKDGLASLRGKATLLGLVGQIDPPRPEVRPAVAACRAAGIKPVMVTGDHKNTGLAIARVLGMADTNDVAVDGRELEAMSALELEQCLSRTTVFARVLPAQKLRIVKTYQRLGHTVAMTGDGVNDAPALMQADVGVAMGITGTDVAKEAAKIVITDDNFASIVAAVEEGRVVYRNIKKAILLLVATSLAEVLVLLSALVVGLPAPFSAVQILWNNLITEGVITINLIMEPAEGDEMRRPPVPRDERLLTREIMLRMAIMTPAIVLSTLGWFAFRISSGAPLLLAQTEAFTLLAVCEWFNVLNCRSERRSALRFDLLKNPWLLGGLVVGNLLQIAVVYWPPLSGVFRTTALDLGVVIALGAVGSLVLWAEEIRKWLARREKTGQHPNLVAA